MICRLVLVLGLWAVASFPSAAQELPSWAAPQQPPERAVDPGPPAMPEDPDIVSTPVDGGLALLALVGAGYAVRRLRR